MHNYLFYVLFLIARGQITAKHREEKESKDKEEVKVKEEPNAVKMNHAINQFHYNLANIKSEIKEVRFRMRLRFGE